VAEATGVSERTIRIILKVRGEHDEEDTSFGTADKERVPKRLTETNNFNKCVGWRTIHDFYAQEGTVPITAKLLVKIEEIADFKGTC
jgi:hypothetical protein